MSFLGESFGIGKPTVEGDMNTLFQVMVEIIHRADEFYRDQVSQYTDEFGAASVSGQGLFKARFQAGLLAVVGLQMLWPSRKDAVLEFAGVASGAAIRDLIDEGSDPKYSREEAAKMADSLILDCMKAMVADLNEGGSAIAASTEGFERLKELHHEALRDSIGIASYSDEVHDRFDPLIHGMIGAEMTHVMDVLREMHGSDAS